MTMERLRTPQQTGRAPTAQEGELWKQTIKKEESTRRLPFNASSPEIPWLEAAAHRNQNVSTSFRPQHTSGAERQHAGEHGDEQSPRPSHRGTRRELVHRIQQLEAELKHEKVRKTYLQYSLRAATHLAATSATSMTGVSYD